MKDLESQKSEHVEETNELKSKVNEYAIKAEAYDTLENDFTNRLKSVSNDLERQVQLNSDYQSKYSEELTRSNQLAKESEVLKESLASHESSIQSLKEQLVAAKSANISKEESLIAEKSTIEEELASTRLKLQELKEHNNMILNQLELNKPSDGNVETSTSDELREVVSYLRREKASIEAKMLVLSEENKRLQQHVEQVSHQLAVTKSEFAKVSSTTVDLNESAKEQARIAEQIEQLNIIRESNTTLRSENKFKSEQLTTISQQLERAKSELDPLKSKIESLTSDLEIANQKIGLVEEENERLKTRIDPSSESDQAVIQAMRDKIKEVRNTANSRLQSQNETIKGLQANVASLNEEIAKLHSTKEAEILNVRSQASSQTEELNKQISAIKDEYTKKLNAVTQEKNLIVAQLNATNKNGSSGSDSHFQEEINHLKESFVKEKQELQKSLEIQFENKLQDEKKKLNDVPQSADSESLKKELASFQLQYKELEQSVEQRKTELEKSFEDKLQQQVLLSLSQPSQEGISEQIELLKKQHTDEVLKLNLDFSKMLEEEKIKTRQQVEKLFEVKIKMLNRKLERLESLTSRPVTPQVPAAIGSANTAPVTGFGNTQVTNLQPNVTAPTSAKSATTSAGANQVPNKPLGFPFSESTLTVHRPVIDRPSLKTPQPQAQSRGQNKNNKRPLNQNQNQNHNQSPAKKQKE